MHRRRFGASADDRRKETVILEGEAKLQVEVGVRDRGKAKASLGRIVQVRADVG